LDSAATAQCELVLTAPSRNSLTYLLTVFLSVYICLSVCVYVVLVASVIRLLIDPDNMLNTASTSAVSLSSVKRTTLHEVTVVVVVVIAQQLVYRQLSRLRKSAIMAGLSHTVSCVGWL